VTALNPPPTSDEIAAALDYLGPEWQPRNRDAWVVGKIALLLREIREYEAQEARRLLRV
jgi:hypothetical protein